MYPLHLTLATTGYDTPSAPNKDVEIKVKIYNTLIWFENPNGSCFSLTADQATIILNGISKVPSIDTIMQERNDWARQTFPEATAKSSLIKLLNEANELEIELNTANGSKEDKTEEIADCIMCLFDIGDRDDITVEDIRVSLDNKMTKNRNRKWKKNPDNTYSHIKS